VCVCVCVCVCVLLPVLWYVMYLREHVLVHIHSR